MIILGREQIGVFLCLGQFFGFDECQDDIVQGFFMLGVYCQGLLEKGYCLLVVAPVQ